MTLANSAPQGLGARQARAVSGFLARPRQTTIQCMLGWVGLSGLTALWLQGLTGALRIHSLISSYESAHGPALAQFEGHSPRAPQFEQLKLSLEAIDLGPGSALVLGLFPVTLLVLFGFWLGCSRWALAHRLVAWRRIFVAAALVVLAEVILLYPSIDAFTSITN